MRYAAAAVTFGAIGTGPAMCAVWSLLTSMDFCYSAGLPCLCLCTVGEHVVPRLDSQGLGPTDEVAFR